MIIFYHGLCKSRRILYFFLILFTPLFFASCTLANDKKSKHHNKQYIGEHIYRNHNEFAFSTINAKLTVKENYPWESPFIGTLPPISKEHFRCKGSALNPVKTVQSGTVISKHLDCGGSDKHSLPLKDGKEHIYPILIELLNYLQAKTGNRVIITSGHRCPEHNKYNESSNSNLYSKHQIGAEVSFYIQTMEKQPEKIIGLLLDYYRTAASYEKKDEYRIFHRWEKEDSNISTFPWYNQEIFIKLFKKNEGRNFDNRHPYPYISIQVRYDKEAQSKVNYSWEQAWNNYLRY